MCTFWVLNSYLVTVSLSHHFVWFYGIRCCCCCTSVNVDWGIILVRSVYLTTRAAIARKFENLKDFIEFIEYFLYPKLIVRFNRERNTKFDINSFWRGKRFPKDEVHNILWVYTRFVDRRSVIRLPLSLSVVKTKRCVSFVFYNRSTLNLKCMKKIKMSLKACKSTCFCNQTFSETLHRVTDWRANTSSNL